MILEPRRVRREEAVDLAGSRRPENTLQAMVAVGIGVAFYLDQNVLTALLVGQFAYTALGALINRR